VLLQDPQHQIDPQPDRIDVPGRDLDAGGHPAPLPTIGQLILSHSPPMFILHCSINGTMFFPVTSMAYSLFPLHDACNR